MRRGRTQAHENTVPVAREWWCNGVTNCPQSVFSRQRRRERGGLPWERTLPACPGCPAPCTQDACAPRSTWDKCMDQTATIRALSLYLPLAVTVLLWLRRRPSLAERAGILLACIWNLDTLLLVHRVASHFDLWTFRAEKGLFLGMPVDLYLGWTLLWGAIPALAFPRIHPFTTA